MGLCVLVGEGAGGYHVVDLHVYTVASTPTRITQSGVIFSTTKRVKRKHRLIVDSALLLSGPTHGVLGELTRTTGSSYRLITFKYTHGVATCKELEGEMRT